VEERLATLKDHISKILLQPLRGIETDIKKLSSQIIANVDTIYCYGDLRYFIELNLENLFYRYESQLESYENIAFGRPYKIECQNILVYSFRRKQTFG
jgi:hypothetical protein